MERSSEPLLRKCSNGQDSLASSETTFCQEWKSVSSMAAPMVAVTVSQYLLQVVSLMMVGHLGLLVSFSGVAIATSFAEVTGFSVLLGMSGALETLCGQTYGAEEYRKFGNYTWCAIVTLILVCLPISLVWIFTDKILMLFSQDPEISHAAREYCIYLIPALFGHAVLQALTRYFQTQSMIFPMVFSSITALCLHVPICWGLVFKFGLGHVGAALAIGASYWLNVVWLAIYMYYSPACQKTRISLSSNALLSIPEFLKYAIPSGLMFCTRVSNELGAGNPKTAKGAVRVVVILGVLEAVIFEEEMKYYLCTGIARGGGFQQIGAYVNLGAYYLVGIPMGLYLGFYLQLQAKGLWMGTLSGSVSQVIILAIVTALTDWQKEATKARERLVENSIKTDNALA
ncbi:hypothetical protein Fmac_016980 [Flemingia macrophylla]|uniref:Multidrug and toxic compound extrusion protein n=1 Tax=Flemingia macrophylla TaxID=520843 RepID=A0ABD1MJ00_9FABA